MRDYNLAKAIIFFVEQKVRELWILWVIIGNVLFSVFVIPATNCIDCSPAQVFWLERIFLHVICFPLLLCSGEFLGIVAFIAIKDNIRWWYRDFIGWIQDNWQQAKERAKKKWLTSG